MSDDAQPSNTSTDSQLASSYGICPGCGLHIHHAQEQCPECGTLAHETGSSFPRHPGTPFFTLLIAVILGVCLLILSRDKQKFAKAEQDYFHRLTGEQIQRPRHRDPASPSPNSPSDFPPDPEPPRKPSPTPAPPSPTATPVPFSPEELGVPAALEPDPAPPPEPEPEPEAEPEAEPEPRPLSTLELRDQLVEEYTRELDEKYPMAKVGDVVDLTQTDNRTIRGRIRQFGTQELILETSIGQRNVLYRQLSRESRMRVDRVERNTWAQEKAVQEVLNRRAP
ncbi:MAG: hypothetical protein WD708_08925 [Kiritimatiellia bacterium]